MCLGRISLRFFGYPAPTHHISYHYEMKEKEWGIGGFHSDSAAETSLLDCDTVSLVEMFPSSSGSNVLLDIASHPRRLEYSTINNNNSQCYQFA